MRPPLGLYSWDLITPSGTKWTWLATGMRMTMKQWFGTPKQLRSLPDPGPNIGLPFLSFLKLPVECCWHLIWSWWLKFITSCQEPLKDVKIQLKAVKAVSCGFSNVFFDLCFCKYVINMVGRRQGFCKYVINMVGRRQRLELNWPFHNFVKEIMEVELRLRDGKIMLVGTTIYTEPRW